MQVAGWAARAQKAWVSIAVIALAVTLMRLPWFGNPAVHVDEAFYLFAGDRLLHGELPFVDIWDRKPVGLFLLYAAIRLLGGDGILAYQIVATGFAIATALLVRALTRPVAGDVAALAAALLYGAYLNVFQGMGGQSPVFYNLFVVLAAGMVQRLVVAQTPLTINRLRRVGCGVMLLLGLAIQIKYTVVFEGVFLGLVLMWLLARTSDWRWSLIVIYALLWVTLALLPTALALIAYALAGHFEAFVFANFLSIFSKTQATAFQAAARVQAIFILLTPLLLMALGSVWELIRHHDARRRALGLFLSGWLIAAFVGFGAVGNYYFHYTLPLLVPLVLASGLWLGMGARGRLVFAPLVLALVIGIQWVRDRNHERQFGSGRETPAILALIERNLRGGCLYVHDGSPILYMLSDACRLTAYSFPYHLNSAFESRSLGVDAVAEVRSIMARRPAVVVTADKTTIEPNLAVRSLLREELARHYELAGAIAVGKRHIQVYALTR